MKRTKKHHAASNPHLAEENERVRLSIHEAWEKASYPGDHNIDGCGCGREECTSLSAYLKGRSWQDMSFKALRKRCPTTWDSPFGYLTRDAFHYFLPGFLLLFLHSSKKLDALASAIVQVLCPHQGWRERVRGFSKAQQRAILEFLQHAENMGYSQAQEGINFWSAKLEADG